MILNRYVLFRASKFNLPLILAFILVISCNPTTKEGHGDEAAVDSAGDAKVIFDGTTFTGWEGPEEFFRIEDAAIVAGSETEEIPTNQFMCTEGRYDDFELTLDAKFTKDYNNGGIQIRSERIPDHHEVIGYQVDVGYSGGKPVWASIYDESRRRKFIAEAPADAIERLLNKHEWNSFKIRAEGARIMVDFNGELVVDYVEQNDSINRSGIICVQIHSGKPSEALYRNIKIKKL